MIATGLVVRDGSASPSWEVETWKPEPKSTKELADACLNERSEPPIGLRRAELPVMDSRVFGFKSTSSKVKELVDKTLTSMYEACDVVSRDDKLFLAG